MRRTTIAAFLACATALAAPLPADDTAGGRRVLAVIGIGHYQNSTWTPVESAETSAKRVVQVIPDNFGYELFEQPLLGQAATLTGINDWLDKLVTSLGAQDDLILYLISHGVSRNEGGYLAPYDAPGLSEAATVGLLGIESLLKKLDESRARNVLVVLDACGSGIAIPGHGGARESSNRRSGSSRIVITSAEPGQRAIADGLQGATLFSGILMDLLNTGACDISAEGYCTATELALLARRRIAEKAERQRPLVGAFGGDETAEFRLVRFGKEAQDWAAARLCPADKIEECADTTKLDQFIQAYPDGVYAAAARKLKRDRLEQAIRQQSRVRTNDLRAVSGNGPRQSVLQQEDENDKGSVYLWIPLEPRPFWMGKFEVSVEEYRRFTRGVMPRAPSFYRDGWDRHGNEPMVNVSWQQARAYCNSRGGELPTWDQWKNAAHANQNFRFPWQIFPEADPKPAPSRANLAGEEDGNWFPAAVDSYADGENVWQLRNLIGNVGEWTATPVKGDEIRRAVVAGGGFATLWRDAGLDGHNEVEIAGNNTVGFRCVVTPGH